MKVRHSPLNSMYMPIRLQTNICAYNAQRLQSPPVVRGGMSIDVARI